MSGFVHNLAVGGPILLGCALLVAGIGQAWKRLTTGRGGTLGRWLTVRSESAGAWCLYCRQHPADDDGFCSVRCADGYGDLRAHG